MKNPISFREITIDKIVELINEAYERGLTGCADLKKQDIDEIIGKVCLKREDNYRIWTVAELKKMPSGSIFHHMVRGRCYIDTKSNGIKFMQFDRGQITDFNSDNDPWDKPMKLIE